MMSYLMIILYSMGIISIYSIGSGLNKIIPIIVTFSVYIITTITLCKKNKTYKLNLINLVIFLFILLSICQGIRSFSKYGILSLNYISLILIYFISTFSSREDIIRFLKFLRIIGIFCVLYGIIEFITGNNMFFQYMNLESAFYKKQFEIYGVVRISTIFGHPIVYGTFLVCLFWIMYFLKGDRELNLYEKIIMILTVINLGLTQSRSSWITFLITIIIYYLPQISFNLRTLKIKILFRWIITIVTIIILHDTILTLFNLIIDRFNDIFTSDGRASLLQRTGAISLIIGNLQNSSFLEAVFGNGLFSTVDLLTNNSIFIQGFTSIDNQYLTILYENGILMLILYLIIFISFILKFYINFQIKEKDYINNMLFFIFFTISINMFFYEAISTKWYSISMLLFISLGTLTKKALSKNLKYISRGRNLDEQF